jgi:4-oxalocrotonate tautomerase
MPHAIIKMFPGRNQEQKEALARAINDAIIATLGSKPASVSVSIEDVTPETWGKTVYGPEIADKPDTLFIKPGYADPR